MRRNKNKYWTANASYVTKRPCRLCGSLMAPPLSLLQFSWNFHWPGVLFHAPVPKQETYPLPHPITPALDFWFLCTLTLEDPSPFFPFQVFLVPQFLYFNLSCQIAKKGKRKKKKKGLRMPLSQACSEDYRDKAHEGPGLAPDPRWVLVDSC